MPDSDSDNLEQLIYISSATHLMTDRELIHLLNQSRLNNMSLDISGMLVYNEGSFIQVLEGPPDALNQTYRKIESDPRHHRCFILLRQKIQVRAFEGWAMGFRSTNHEEVENIIGYIDFFGDRPVPERGAAAYRLLESFRRQHEREIQFSN